MVTFDTEFPTSETGTNLTCRSCVQTQGIDDLEMEQSRFFEGEERCQLRCCNCGVVILTLWNQEGQMPEHGMTHNELADLIGDLRGTLTNVMTDEQIESFEEEIADLEERIRYE